jgi:hypothetical protein
VRIALRPRSYSCQVRARLLAGNGSSSEVHWTRLTWLFSTVEAVVFGAAGALFGASVQRQRAETAERRANANERDAISGRALAAATLADGAEAAMSPGEEAYGPRQPGSDVATRHAAIARNLFPDIAEPRS